MPLNPTGSVKITVGPTGSVTNYLILPQNPDESLQPMVRVTILQTLSGAYADVFGLGVPSLTLTGSTLYKSPTGNFNGQYVDGFDAAKHLYMDIFQYYFSIEQNKTSPLDAEMIISDSVTERSWTVIPVGQPTFNRVSSNPLVLTYTMYFAVLKDNMESLQTPSQIVNDPLAYTIEQLADSMTINPSITYAVAAKTSAKKTVAVKKSPVQTYTVISGDTLWGIAQRFYASYGGGPLYTVIAKYNSIANPSMISIGQILKIPIPPVSSTVSDV